MLSCIGAVLLLQQVVRVAVEGRALLGRDVVSNLIDVVEAPLLLLLPKIIKPRNEEVQECLGMGPNALTCLLYFSVRLCDTAVQTNAWIHFLVS